MDNIDRFYKLLSDEMTVTLATSANDVVTMRAVSPVVFRGKMLFFAAPTSTKIRQLQINPLCGVGAGDFYAQARAELCGATMLPENAEMRKVYCEKFPGAFDEGMEHGGREDVFVLLSFTKLTGWVYEEGALSGSAAAFPTIPFSIDLK